MLLASTVWSSFLQLRLVAPTWEDPNVVDQETGKILLFVTQAYLLTECALASGAAGDDDPIDAIEIGTEGALGMGSVVRVKVLGSMSSSMKARLITRSLSCASLILTLTVSMI